MCVHFQIFRTAPCIVALACLLSGSSTSVRAHAELEAASPPAGGTITSLPASLTLTFTEEVKPGAVSVTVTGPDGTRVDNGGASVDLYDPERVTVVVPLLFGSEGTYLVSWQAISNIDEDQTDGEFSFAVVSAEGTPVETTAATPEDPVQSGQVDVAATIDPDRNGNPLSENSDYDSRAFAISVGAGLLALAAIVGFWLLVRPRNPRFGPRSPDGKE